jgi:hypothetical protein
MDERARDTEEKIRALEAAMAAADDDAIVEAAMKADLALQFRDADEMIGLDPVDPERVERLRALVGEALAAAAARGKREAATQLAERRAAQADFDGAVAALAPLATKGDAQAAALAARYVLRGALSKKRATEVAGWLAAASARDDDGAVAYAQALFAFHGLGAKKDLRASVALHEAAAAKGHADAMFELYAMRSQGLGCDRDPAAAMSWCRRAAEAGNARAMANLGGFYATGNGVEKDVAESVRWYDRAAQAGHGKAAATLGVMYAMGGDLARDVGKAREYFARAEELGFPWESLCDAVGIDPDEYA